MWKTSVFAISVINLCSIKVVADLTISPKTTVTKVGEDTYLNCSTNKVSSRIHWYHGTEYVYAGGSIFNPYLGRFQVENVSLGAYNLVIRSVNQSDAGKYTCQDDEGGGQKHSAELIVIENDPVCASNFDEVIGPNSCDIEVDEVKVTCTLTYNGNILLELVWKSYIQNNIITNGVTRTTSGNTVTSILVFKANDLMNSGRSFICETTQSTNHLPYRCSTPVMTILYALSTFTHVNKSMGEEILCSASSSQKCSYKWKWLKDQDKLTVSDNEILKPDRVGNYQCEAECTMKNKYCTIVPMIIVVSAASSASTPENNSKLWFVVIAVVVILVLEVIAAIVIFVKRRRLRKNTNETNQSSAEGGLGQAAESLLSTSTTENGVREDTAYDKHDSGKHSTAELLPLNAEDHNGTRTVVAIEVEKEEEAKPDIVTLISKKKEDSQNAELDQNNCKPETWKVIAGKEIRGMIVGDDMIYVLTYDPIRLEIYNITSHRNVGERSLTDIVTSPIDVTYCPRCNRLYVMDGTRENEEKKIITLNQFGTKITEWSTEEYVGNLSVSSDSNIVIATPTGIIEYSPAGTLIHRVEVHKSIPLLCSIKVDIYELLVSHMDDVCMVKGSKHASDGKYCVEEVEKSFDRSNGLHYERLNEPRSLAVDGNGYIFVLDAMNNRILILNSSLEFKEEILLDEYGLQSPVKLCLNEYSFQSQAKLCPAESIEQRRQLIVTGNSVDDKNSSTKGPGILVLPLW